MPILSAFLKIKKNVTKIKKPKDVFTSMGSQLSFLIPGQLNVSALLTALST